jgi:acyl-CoA thioesterase I
MLLPSTLLAAAMLTGQAAYLQPIVVELEKQWPQNRAINLVFHGHSVPAGYFATPNVDTLNAYPHLVLDGLKRRFPFAVINVIVTAIGGENSVSGQKRFERDVLTHKPDVLFIDYGLNDRGLPLADSRSAWTAMVRSAKANGIKVILLTPTADTGSRTDDPNDPLCRQAAQIREIAAAEQVGLVDSFEAFVGFVHGGGNLGSLMAQSNHPNRKGHELVADRILKWFPATRK